MCTPNNQTSVVEDQIQQLQAAALRRIEEAQDLDALEQVRVDVLGRKGLLAQFNVGKLPPRSAKRRARRSTPRNNR